MRIEIFESSREFFYPTIPNVNYGMTDADFDVLVDQRQSADEKFTQKKVGNTAQAREIILHIGPDNGGHWKVIIKK